MQAAKAHARALSEINQLKKKIAALEKEVANAKELIEKLKVCTGGHPAHAQGLHSALYQALDPEGFSAMF